MADLKDTFGKALMAHHLGEPAVHVIERDDGFIDEIDTGSYFLPHEEWPDFEREAVREAQGRVLDVGCGAGRVAVWLQEAGHEVVGIDVSPLALEVSKGRGVRHCMLMDVRELEFPGGHFDTVLMLGNNLGIGGNVEATRGGLEGLHRVTGKGGIILAGCMDPLQTDKPHHISYHERNRRRGLPPGLVRIRIGFKGEFGAWFDLLFVGEGDLRGVLEPTGWEISRIYSSGGPRYVAVLTKKD